MKEFEVNRITNLFAYHIIHLVDESKKEGFRFLERLVDEYKNGTNNFNKPGESLYGIFNKDRKIIAIGGINIDPFTDEQKIGRLRRFYVARDYRRNGIGRYLLERVIRDSKRSFSILVLYTDTKEADTFYTSLGFSKKNKYPKSTHYLKL